MITIAIIGKSITVNREKYIQNNNIKLEIKRGNVREKKLDRLDIATVINFIEYYFSHMSRVWLDVSLEGKLTIGCSVLPNGLIVENNKYPTPQLGRRYVPTQGYSTPSVKLGEPAGIRTQNQ